MVKIRPNIFGLHKSPCSFLFHFFMEYVEAPWLWRPLGNCPACPFLNPALVFTVYRQYTNLFLFRFVSEDCMPTQHTTLISLFEISGRRPFYRRLRRGQRSQNEKNLTGTVLIAINVASLLYST